MLASCIPTFVVVVKDLEAFSNTIQSQIEALVSTSETYFITAQSKLFDLLWYSQLLYRNNLCTSSAYNSREFDICIAWFLEINIEE